MHAAYVREQEWWSLFSAWRFGATPCVNVFQIKHQAFCEARDAASLSEQFLLT